MAELIDINPKYLSSIERGEENPTLDLFIRLAGGLKVELHEIFQFEYEDQQSKRLHTRLQALMAEIKEEELARMVHILEALVH